MRMPWMIAIGFVICALWARLPDNRASAQDSSQMHSIFSLDPSKELESWYLNLYPDSIQKQIKIEAEFVAKGPGPLHITVSPYFARIDGRNHYSAISRYFADANIMTHTDELIIERDKPNKLDITYSGGKLRIVLNGTSFGFSSKYDPTIDKIGVTLPKGSVFTRLEAYGVKTDAFPKSLRAKEFTHGMAMGFAAAEVQDVCDKEWLAKAIKAIADVGVKRLYWIYYGGQDHGFWDPVGDYFIYRDKKVAKTFASIGKNPLELATQYAHENGMEIYALIKPFDGCVMGLTFPTGSKLAQQYGKLDVLGGVVYPGMTFPLAHPELSMRRMPIEPQLDPVEKIVIQGNNKQVKLPDKIEVWVSKDNWKYKLYKKPYSIDKSAGRIVIKGLAIRDKFIAVSAPENQKKWNIENTLDQLMKVYDVKGKQVSFTYGLSPRKHPFATGPNCKPGGVFQEDGFAFDSHNLGMPTMCLSASFATNAFVALDNSEGVLGIAIGQNQFIPGTMEPAEPKARQYWLDMISEALDYGIDGIDLRIAGHTNVLEWGQYGFNRPIVEEYRKRHGVDILTEDYDKEKLRILRGEYYTQFLREAKQLTKKRGRKLQLHVFEMIEGSADTPTLAEIDFKWRQWLDEDIPDAVTYKFFNPKSYTTHFGRELIAKCNAKGIPVYWCGGADHGVRNSGVDGTVMYEFITYFKTQPDGEVVPRDPGAKAWFHKIAE